MGNVSYSAFNVPQNEANKRGTQCMIGGSNARFVKVGLPFFSIVFGGAYVLHYFQEVRYDYRSVQKRETNFNDLKTDLSSTGLKLRENITIDELVQEVSSIDTDNWDNIRGPRESEDLSEYKRINSDNSAREAGDSPPEPETPISSSRRAVRGSPTPSSSSSSVQPASFVVPDPFDPSNPGSSPLVSESFIEDLRPCSSEEEPSSTTTTAVPNHPSDPTGLEANRAHLSSLLELGFDEYTAQIALLRTANEGVEAAVQWIVERSNESDFEEESGEENDREAMGGNLSTAAISGRTHKMVFVANTSLKMGPGKIAAQVGHATLNVYRQASASEEGRNQLETWRRHGETKIVLKGESTEQLMDLLKSARDAGLFCYLVADAGRTQIPAGSRTVLGVFGAVETVDSVTGHLKLL